jgi:hypothetical protein
MTFTLWIQSLVRVFATAAFYTFGYRIQLFFAIRGAQDTMGTKKKSHNDIPKGAATRRRKESCQADSNIAASTSSASLIEAAQQEEDKKKR